VKNKEKTIII